MTDLTKQSRNLLHSHGASQLFLDILEANSEPPDFLEGIFHPPNEYFNEDEAIEFTEGLLIPLFDDGGPSIVTFFNPVNNRFLEKCLEDEPQECGESFANWQQVLCSIVNQAIENNEADSLSLAQQTGFLHIEKLLEFRRNHSGSSEWDEQFSSFVATF